MLVFSRPERPPLVVIDDDAAEATMLSNILTVAGYPVTVTTDGLAGLLAVEEVQPALVLLAWGLPFVTSEIVIYALQVGLAQPPLVVALMAPGSGDSVGKDVAAILPRWPTEDTVLTVVDSLLPPVADIAS